LEEHAAFEYASIIGLKRQSKYLQRARNRDIQHILPGIEDQTIRIRKSTQKQAELSTGTKPKDTSNWVFESTLARIREVKIAIVSEHQVVQPAEAVDPAAVQYDGSSTVNGIKAE
jgi:hypothetical protein